MSWSSIGVPNIPGLPDGVSAGLIQFGGAALINALFGNYWGVFDQNGLPLLLVDNVVSVKYDNKSKVSSAPLEMGSFASYNRVADPFNVTVRVTKASGGVFERGAFLGLLEALSKRADLFMVITPEAIYPNCNIVGYDYVREPGDGARMIKANIHLQEIRQVTAKYETKQIKSETKDDAKDGGTVQGSDASFKETSVLASLADKAGINSYQVKSLTNKAFNTAAKSAAKSAGAL